MKVILPGFYSVIGDRREMGKIGFDGWKVVLDDIDKLNGSEEISQLGLNFECHGDHMEAETEGNVANYLGILAEVKNRMLEGRFKVTVTLSSGKTKEFELTAHRLTENGKDIPLF